MSLIYHYTHIYIFFLFIFCLRIWSRPHQPWVIGVYKWRLQVSTNVYGNQMSNMTKDQRQSELYYLIQRYGLMPRQIAEICGVSLGTAYGWTTELRSVVWFQTKTIPEKHLESLKKSLCQN